MKVLKFGGTSMGSVESIRNISNIIKENKKEDLVIVCSAMTQVTNQLIDIWNNIKTSDKDFIFDQIDTLKKKHLEIFSAFGVDQDFEDNDSELWEGIKKFIDVLVLTHEFSDKNFAYFCSFGERFSSQMLTKILISCGIDAVYTESRFIKTNNNYLEADIDWEKTKSEIKLTLQREIKGKKIPVVTGFFGTDDEGLLTLLGRGGTDFSASIIASCLKAQSLEIWKDVDGFMSADPRIIAEAHTLPVIGFKEASELCFFGAKVLHPKSIRPVIDIGGEVWIKNTFNPTNQGTCIKQKVENSCYWVLSVASKKCCLIEIDFSTIRMGSSREETCLSLFQAIYDHKVAIDTMASSESSISFAMHPRYLKNKLFIEDLKAIADIEILDKKEIVCIVSPADVKGTVGIAAEFFQAISEGGISITMYSQSSSEISQVMVVDEVDSEKTIKLIHKRFTMGACRIKSNK